MQFIRNLFKRKKSQRPNRKDEVGFNSGSYSLPQASSSEDIERYEHELTNSLEKQDWRNVAYWSGTIAHVYSNLDQLEKAHSYYQTALINSRKIDEKLSEIIYLSNLGAISYRMGKLNTSIDQYQEALDISRATGYRKNEAKCLGGLALTFSMMGDKKSAIYFYEKSIDINEETGDQHNQAVQLSNLGNEYIDLGYIAQAVIHIEAAISIFEEIQPELAEFNRERVRILRKELNE